MGITLLFFSGVGGEHWEQEEAGLGVKRGVGAGRGALLVPERPPQPNVAVPLQITDQSGGFFEDTASMYERC